jgi:hypothetical protein
MLERIHNQKSSLDFLKLERERKEQERMIANIAQHPHIFKVRGNILHNSVTKLHNPVSTKRLLPRILL